MCEITDTSWVIAVKALCAHSRCSCRVGCHHHHQWPLTTLLVLCPLALAESLCNEGLLTLPVPGVPVKVEDPKYKKDKQLNEKISLFRGDITKLEVDAIVNAGE